MIMLTIITNNQVKQHNTNSKTTNSNKSNSLVLRPCSMEVERIPSS